MKAAGIPATEQPIYRVSPKRFLKAIRKAKKANSHGWMVEQKSFSEYKHIKTYLTHDGKSQPPVVAMTLPRSVNEIIKNYQARAEVNLDKVKTFDDWDKMMQHRNGVMTGRIKLSPSYG